MSQQLIDQLKLQGSPLQQIAQVQTLFAQLFEFENLDVLLKNEEPITEQFLLDKMVDGGRGGVCYELNGLLHIVLKQLGFDVSLATATVWEEQRWILDRTHTINLFTHEKTLYLLDSGSGNNLSMAPIPLDGDPVSSPAGTFRLRTLETERGSVVCERQTKDDWTLRYAFEPEIVDWEDLNRIKELIHHHPDSPFNKTLLVAKTIEDGTFSITEERYFRKWKDGRTETIHFDKTSSLLEQIKIHATPAVYEAAMRVYE
ncbi:arylamine N-acetyltransferase family protein [Sporosarcina obsidiansis]|uniref:arylamine N-acetyltransferase family protein n=1 Tax=Sporosarcina obsidiansis TaxID=2660748 RepID=UPI00129BC0CD|nr:arylamine N-acetyltransferase [Sporosarcina obsidiansis]